MHKGFIESCLIILASAGWTFAQGPPSGYPAIGQQLSPGWASSDIGGSCCPRGGEDCGPRFWVGADYLLWWFKDGPLRECLLKALGAWRFDPFPGQRPTVSLAFGIGR